MVWSMRRALIKIWYKYTGPAVTRHETGRTLLNLAHTESAPYESEWTNKTRKNHRRRSQGRSMAITRHSDSLNVHRQPVRSRSRPTCSSVSHTPTMATT